MERHALYNEMAARLLAHVENGTTDYAEDTMRVAANSYTDSGVWQKEMDGIFTSLPIMVGVTQEVAAPGDFKTLDILGKPLLITRQQDGSVKVLLNVCTHRGMTLESRPCGNQKTFSCPYHAWTYGGDGRLRGVADVVKFGEDCRGDRDLTAFPCHEEGGLIFAVLDPDSDCDIRSFLGGMMDDVAEKHFEDWYYVGQRVIQGANWKVALDGYLEGYHFQAAHPETIAPRTYTNIMAFESYGPHMLVGYPAKTIQKLADVPKEELWQHENDGYDFIRLFFPNVSIFVAPEITQVAQLIPGPGPLENTTVLHFFHHIQPADEEGVQGLEQMADWLRQVVDEEDYQVGLQVQRGLQSGHLADVIFGRNESGNQFAHRCIQYYSDGAQGEAPTL